MKKTLFIVCFILTWSSFAQHNACSDVNPALHEEKNCMMLTENERRILKQILDQIESKQHEQKECQALDAAASRTDGVVAASSWVSHNKAAVRSVPHISTCGCRPPQKSGRSAWPNTAQRMSGINCTQGTPAGFPSGMPGMGLEMEGAVQQAPQPGRQVMSDCPGASLSS